MEGYFNSIHKDCEINYYPTDANRPHKKTAIFELLFESHCNGERTESVRSDRATGIQ